VPDSPISIKSRSERTYALGAVARLTGLSPDTLRAWERRYGVVEPLRTPGGTRRYRESDVRKLRLLARASQAGHSIGTLAGLEESDLIDLTSEVEETRDFGVTEAMDALRELDAARIENIASLQLAALGPARFARQFAEPLATAMGEGWMRDDFCIASEHMGTAVLRSLLGLGLRAPASSRRSPPIVFATPPGERHELGLLVAALTATGAGGNVIYLGADLPIEEILRAAELKDAGAVALSLVTIPISDAQRVVAAVRGGLRQGVQLWLGGPRASEIELPAGVDCMQTLEDLEQRVSLLPSAT
jgi:DNA-binding transcriptional MerR regulator/methylmalonyl-CoA mutase cobalamin-binding subunit